MSPLTPVVMVAASGVVLPNPNTLGSFSLKCFSVTPAHQAQTTLAGKANMLRQSQ